MQKSLLSLVLPVLVAIAGAGVTVAAHAQTTAQEAPKSREAVKAEAKAARKAGTIVEGDKAGMPASGAGRTGAKAEKTTGK